MSIRKSLCGTTAAAALLALMSTPAMAQAPAPAPAEEKAAEEVTSVDEVLITGTQIRGVAPTGSTVQQLDEKAIEQSGAFTVPELMATIPQLQGYGMAYSVSPGADAVQPPTIRGNLGNGTIGGINPLGAGGTGTTLILLDGLRMPGVGYIHSFSDPSIIPPTALKGVSIVTGGGSAIYGADAVGGIINFTTRTDFDGTEVGARYGFTEDGYEAYSFDIGHGFKWDGGSLGVFYSYNGNDELLNRDLSNRIYDFTPWGGTDQRPLACDPATIAIGAAPATTYYNSATKTPYGIPPRCNTDSASRVSEVTAQSVFAGLQQDLPRGMTLEVRAYYSDRQTTAHDLPAVFNPTVSASNPAFASHRIGVEPSHQVFFSFDGEFEDTNVTDQMVWGIRPQLIVPLGDDWQFRTAFNYGASEFFNHNTSDPSATSIQAAVNGTLPGQVGHFLNPYDVGSSEAGVVNELWDTRLRRGSEQSIMSANAIFDGPLFGMPSGEQARVAAGVEFSRITFQGVSSEIDAGSPPTIDYTTDSDRTVSSAFAELYLPIVGAENNVPLVNELNVSFAVRYDEYSDFGGTTNPKVGVVWRPVESLALRGNWGTSFTAPSLSDTGGAADGAIALTVGGGFNTVLFILGLPNGSANPNFVNWGVLAPAFGVPNPVLVLRGGKDLKPEESESFEIGFDWDVPWVDGLRVSSTYYDLSFENRISFSGLQGFTHADEGLWILANEPGDNLTRADFENFLKDIGVSPDMPHTGFGGVGTDLGDLYTGAYPGSGFLGVPAGPLLVIDGRRSNLGSVKTTGIDFSVSYFQTTSWGTVFANLNANQVLEDRRKSSKNAAWVDATKAINTAYGEVTFTASAGFSYGPWTARGTFTYFPGYSLTDAASNAAGFDEVEAFTPFNFFTSYDFPQTDGPLSGLSASLNIENLFEEEPSFALNRVAGGNGNTLGRLISVGVRKRF